MYQRERASWKRVKIARKRGTLGESFHSVFWKLLRCLGLGLAAWRAPCGISHSCPLIGQREQQQQQHTVISSARELREHTLAPVPYVGQSAVWAAGCTAHVTKASARCSLLGAATTPDVCLALRLVLRLMSSRFGQRDAAWVGRRVCTATTETVTKFTFHAHVLQANYQRHLASRAAGQNTL